MDDSLKIPIRLGLIKRTLSHFGQGPQEVKAIEEMAELTQALARPSQDRNHIREEIADALIMLFQMREAYGPHLVDEWVNMKQDRLGSWLDRQT